jgi:hypothetical protein
MQQDFARSPYQADPISHPTPSQDFQGLPLLSSLQNSLDTPQSHANQSSAKTPGPPVATRHWQRTEVYSSGGTAYARYRWGKGSESFGYVHIAGGAAAHPAVLARRAQVDEAISGGRSLLEILDLLRSFGEAQRGRKPRPESVRRLARHGD